MIEEKYRGVAELAEELVEGIKRSGLKVIELRDRAAKVMMPLKGNKNHIGDMYAGSMFTLGEIVGGIIPAVSIDVTRFIPIVKTPPIECISQCTCVI